MDNQDDGQDCQLTTDDAQEVITDPIDETPVAAAALLNIPTIKYAPVMPVVGGHYDLYCVVLKWIDNPGENAQHASNACHQAAQTWRQLSNGAFTFDVIDRHIAVSFTHNPSHLHDAEAQAKHIIGPVAANHIYVIFNNNNGNVSHGSGDTAHLIGALTRDVLHEMGHCHPTNLGHSGAFKDGVLKPYDDGTSFMGRFASDKLTGAQLYLLGWLPQNKVAQFDVGDAPTDFNVQNLYGSNDGDNVKVVLIPRGDQRPLYLSMPQINGKPTLCLHLSAGRGTQRVAVFGNQAQYQGISFQKIADNGSVVTVRVSSTA